MGINYQKHCKITHGCTQTHTDEQTSAPRHPASLTPLFIPRNVGILDVTVLISLRQYVIRSVGNLGDWKWVERTLGVGGGGAEGGSWGNKKQNKTPIVKKKKKKREKKQTQIKQMNLMVNQRYN